MIDYILNIIKNIAAYSSWCMFIVIIIGFTKISRNKEDEEDYFIFKLVGFYLLGGLHFSLNEFSIFPFVIPVGFIIYLGTMKDKDRLNKYAKRKAAQFGVIMLSIGMLNGIIYESLDYRDIRVKNFSKNVTYLDKEWIGIRESLGIASYSNLIDFRLTYDKNNTISSLFYTVVDFSKNKRYTITNSGLVYSVEVNKHQDENQYTYNDDVYISADEFMKCISKIKFENSSMANGKDIVEYYVTYESHFNQTGSTIYDGDNIYIIDDWDKFTYSKANKKNLPIEGIIINHSPMEKITLNSNTSTKGSTNTGSYILYANTNSQLINENSEILTIENRDISKVISLDNYNSDIFTIVQSLEFDIWQEVDIKEIKGNEYIILTDDSTTITFYKDSNYALYQWEDDKFFYEVPNHVINYISTLF